MRFTLSDKIIAYLTLFSGLTISAVAIYYSVAGLVSIFAAAAIPIIVMGVVLEVSKLIATVWLKVNWERAPFLIRTYLLTAIVILMVITSMGIFGFLSKAHSDQTLVSGDVQSKISLYDEKIKIERENIANAQQVIKQMDAAVNGVITTGDQEVKLRDGSTKVNSAAERSLQIRRSQAKDRALLTKQIEESQTKIVKLQEESAPIRAEVRKVEAEVGPIKYIAKLIYSDNPDTNLLEKAVTWVILIIVIVFDPLAVILLLASQYSFQWFRKQEEEQAEGDSLTTESKDDIVAPATVTTDTEEDVEEFFLRGKLVARGLDADEEARLVAEANDKIAEIEPEVVEPYIPDEPEFDEKKPLDEWNEMIAEAEKAADAELEKEDEEILNSVTSLEKEAMRKWKEENQQDSLKHQRRLLEKGIIDKLPWQDYLAATPDFIEDEAAEEAAKWAAEQLEIKKKDNGVDGTAGQGTGQEDQGRLSNYQQNAEQNERTLWQRIQDAKK